MYSTIQIGIAFTVLYRSEQRVQYYTDWNSLYGRIKSVPKLNVEGGGRDMNSEIYKRGILYTLRTYLILHRQGY